MRENVALELHDASGRAGLALVMRQDGVPFVVLGDAVDDERAKLSVEADGTPMLVLGDSGGAGLTLASGRGLTGIDVRDSRGRSRIGAGVSDDGQSALLVFGDGGETIWQAP
jgi:hypothetical protein